MKSFQFHYQEYESRDEVPKNELHLLLIALESTKSAYAPYSHFHVGAAVLLNNKQVVTGINIENASYPVGICAERSALSAAISAYPNEKIEAIAIGYSFGGSKTNIPAFPCGMCRQFISECEDRNKDMIKLILGGEEGSIVIIQSAKHLLPFSFSGKNLEE